MGFQFAKQVAAIFLSAFAGNMYDRIGFQETYMILGGIALTVTLISAFTLAGKTKTEPLRMCNDRLIDRPPVWREASYFTPDKTLL